MPNGIISNLMGDKLTTDIFNFTFYKIADAIAGTIAINKLAKFMRNIVLKRFFHGL